MRAALRQDVQQRAAGRRPATAREQILLTVDRQVVGVLVRDDLRRDRRIIFVALNDSRRTLGRGNATLGLAFACVLRIFPHFHQQLRREVRQPLHHVPHGFRQQLLFAVGIAVLVGIRSVDDDFLARQVSRQPFVTLLARLATFVRRDDVRFFDRFGQAIRRIGRFIRIPEVEPQLIRIVNVCSLLAAKRSCHSLR